MKLVRLFGYGKGGEGRAAKEDKDSLQSRAYAYFVDLISEGPIEGFCNEEGVTIKDALLNFQPDVGGDDNGLRFRTEDGWVKDIDDVVIGKLDGGVVRPIVNADNQGYPYNENRPIKLEIYLLRQTKKLIEEEVGLPPSEVYVDPTAAVIYVHVYPKTEQQRTDYLALEKFNSYRNSVVPEDIAKWQEFQAKLKVYPEGKVRGVSVNDPGKDYEDASEDGKVGRNYKAVLPRASAAAMFFDNVPAADPTDLKPRFKDIGVQYRLGYEDQSVMPGFTSVSQIYNVESEPITHEETAEDENDTPYTYQTDTAADYDRVIFDINFTNGLYMQDMKKGDIKALYNKDAIRFSVYHSRGYINDQGIQVWDDPLPLGGIDTPGEYYLQGKTMSSYERSYDVRLNKGDNSRRYYWKFFFRRLTPDDATLGKNTGGEKRFTSTFRLSRITAITEQKFSYPNCAVIGVRVNAEQFNKIPTRSYRLKLLRCLVPDNYFPPFSIKIIKDAQGNELRREIRKFAEYCRNSETGEGVYTAEGEPIEQEWKGGFYVSWTNNPAWVGYNICMNNYWGMGKVIPIANKWFHYKIGRYCDEHGKFSGSYFPEESRFTCNLYFQAREEAFKVLTDTASVFSGFYYYGGGQMVPVQDAPRPVRMSFTPANVKDGMFTYQGTQRKVRHTVAVIRYNDPLANYNLAPVYVEDVDGMSRYGYQALEKVAIGCTVQGQARRLGRRLLRQELSNTDVVKFVTGLQAAVLRPGDVFSVYDPVRSTVPFGGRILEVVQGSSADEYPIIVTDREIDNSVLCRAAGVDTFDEVKPADFKLVCTKPTVEKFNISSSEEIDRMLQAQVTKPLRIKGFGLDPKGRRTIRLADPLPAEVGKGMIWGLQHANVNPQYFSTISVEESSKHEFNVTGVEYHHQIYDEIFKDEYYEEDRIVPDLNYWKRPGPPRNLLLRFSTVRDQGVTKFILSAGWSRPEFGWAKDYKVYLRKNLGNYQFQTDTDETHADMPLAEPDSYTVRVYARGITGILSEPAEANIGYLSGGNRELISGLEVYRQGNDNKFYSGDLILDWRVNWSQKDSSLSTNATTELPGTIDSYVLHLYDANNVLLANYSLLETGWTLTLDQNRQLPNGPHRDFIVDVRARTNDMALSAPSRIRVTNDAPPALVADDITVSTNELATFSIHFKISRAGVDFAGYRIWASETQGFTPDATNLLWEGRSNVSPNLTVAGNPESATIYFRVAEFDILSKSVTDCNISAEMSVAVLKNLATSEATLSVFDFIWRP